MSHFRELCGGTATGVLTDQVCVLISVWPCVDEKDNVTLAFGAEDATSGRPSVALISTPTFTPSVIDQVKLWSVVSVY
jgi:hypothetical protein